MSKKTYGAVTKAPRLSPALLPCRDCGCETYRQTDTDAIKAAVRARGGRRHCGRRMCTTCYARWQRSGVFRPLIQENAETPARPCTRCGINQHRRTSLCIDCEEVAAELDEFPLWAAS